MRRAIDDGGCYAEFRTLDKMLAGHLHERKFNVTPLYFTYWRHASLAMVKRSEAFQGLICRKIAVNEEPDATACRAAGAFICRLFA